ncbi:sugar nucleotidyltransferase domain protein [Natronomonas pharaonis DSM 2160]|uniref:Sugar nucleotidyltransferase domain protein n=1 Tax=Natronomonas pharaonis (strain ATCC 35678 / DSM 2160 / CIP 103997 / JCM 8858 / NBRC 14720 / NCIMB 2260 / Gabara) TaxID=348780 RepID=A0A1U7EVK5_NATPD|nr:sugar nucleotidyltransferase domain protein [Natronomonas pharaonis DSM 2160]
MAVHLAAGQGTRLRPLTDDRPKPLVELGGQSLLEQNVETLKEAGVRDHVVVTGYEGDQIVDRGFETVHNDVYDETEMIYSLFCAAEAFPDSGEGDLLISYGDIVYERDVVEALLDCSAPLCVAVDRQWRKLWEERFEDPLSDAETLDIDDKGRIHEIGETPEGYDTIDAQYVGLLKVRNDHIDRFVDAYTELDAQTDGYVSIDTTAFLQQLIDDGWHLQAVSIDRGWLEVDTLEDLERYRELHSSGELSQFVDI